MHETLNLAREIRNPNRTGIRVFRGSSDGRDFVRVDTVLAGAAYCVRLKLSDASALGDVLRELGGTGDPTCGGPR